MIVTDQIEILNRKIKHNEAKFEYSPLGMSLNKAFNKKVSLRTRVILVMILIMLFSNFRKVMMNLDKCH